MSSDPSPPVPKRRWLGGVGCALTFVIGTPTILLLLCLSGWLYIQYRISGYRQQLAAQEQRIRDAGEPLDGAELNAWYRIPEGEEDLTPLYLEILRPLQGDGKLPGSENIPYFGVEADTIPLPGEPWEGIAASEAFLAEYDETFSLLLKAAQRKGSVRYPIDFREGVAMRLPHAQSLRQLCRLCCLRATVLCHREGYADATEILIAALRASETLEDEPNLISQMVRLAMHGVIQQAITVVLVDDQFPAGQIDKLKAELSTVDRTSAAETSLLGERSGLAYQAILGTLNQLSDNPGSGTGGTADRPLREIRPGDCALTLELLSDAVEACRGDYPGIWRRQAAFVDKVDKIIADDKKKADWEKNIVTQLLLPAYDAAFLAFARGLAEHRCTIALLAAAQYRREMGEYPQSLQDLVPKYLAEVPADPYTGQPLMMKYDGNRLVIYATGKNERDDDGQIQFTPGREPRDMGLAVPPFRAEAK